MAKTMGFLRLSRSPVVVVQWYPNCWLPPNYKPQRCYFLAYVSESVIGDKGFQFIKLIPTIQGNKAKKHYIMF